jgi:hypothetical protein
MKQREGETIAGGANRTPFSVRELELVCASAYRETLPDRLNGISTDRPIVRDEW